MVSLKFKLIYILLFLTSYTYISGIAVLQKFVRTKFITCLLYVQERLRPVCASEQAESECFRELNTMNFYLSHPNFLASLCRERSGSVVECLTRDRRAAGSSLTGVTALWSLSKTHLS